MSNLISNIFQIKKSKPYIDYNNYHKGNIFGITKMSRRELMHSNFIAWALNPESSHGLRFYPLYQLVQSLNSLQANENNKDARKIPSELVYNFCDDDFIIDASIVRESPVPVGNNRKYIDILIEIITKDKILPIIIENKVESQENGENKDQTQVYYNWAENEYVDRDKYYEPIYVFLYPEYNAAKQSSSAYIRMTYQNLVDDVLDPSMERCGDIISINNYKMYLQCLSFQTDNEKGEDTMAISSEERRILNDFVSQNRDLLCAVINELPVDDAAKSAITNGIRYQYQFDGKTYGVGPLALAVVKKYVEDHRGCDFTTVQAAFPKKLRGGDGVVQLSVNVSDKDKGKIDGKKRYFVATDEVILLDSGEELLVSNQWTKEKMPDFIKNATNLGYTIVQL
jgi:hypothetical protein